MTGIYDHYFTITLEGDDATRFASYADRWCALHSIPADDWTLRSRKWDFTNIAEPVYRLTLSFKDKDIAALWKLSWPGPELESGSTKNPGV